MSYQNHTIQKHTKTITYQKHSLNKMILPKLQKVKKVDNPKGVLIYKKAG